MRLGEILLNAKLIDQKQLADGLSYAKAKAIPIGRVLKLLRFIEEDDLKSALRIQELIRLGLHSDLAIPMLTRVGKERVSMDRALIDLIMSLHSNGNGKGHDLQVQVQQPAAVAASVEPAPVKAKMSPAELLKEGDMNLAADRCTDAEKFYLQAKENTESLFGQGNLETTGPLLKLAHLYLVTDRFGEAESLYMQILQVKQQSFGEQHPAVAEALEDIADLYIAREEFDRARQFLHIAIMIREQGLPKDIDPFMVTLKRLTVVMQHKGFTVDLKKIRLGELLTEAGLVGTAQLQQALQQSRASGIPLGSVLQENGSVSARDLRSVLNAQFAIKEKQLPDQIAIKALKVAYMKGVGFKELVSAAGLIAATSQDENSLRLVLDQERLLSLEMEHGPEASIVADAVIELADKFAERNSLPEAEGLYRRAIAILRKLPDRVADADNVAHKLAHLYMQNERYSQAEPLLLESLQSRSASGETESVNSFVYLKDLARLAHLQDNTLIAANFLRSAISVLLSLKSGYTASLSDIKWMLLVLLDSEQIDLAQHLIRNQVSNAETTNGANHLDTARLQEEAGDFLFKVNNKAEAKAYFRKALTGYRSSLSPGDESVARIAEKLSHCAM
jgi:tetratricopeptide (TPR) repeat protein